MRAILILLWVAVAAFVVMSVVRRLSPAPRRRTPDVLDELVKDPMCETYVVRSRAIQRTVGGEPLYFCSDECARRYAARG